MSIERPEAAANEDTSIEKREWRKPTVSMLNTWEAEGADGSGPDAGLNS